MGRVRYILAGGLIDGSGGAVRRHVYLAMQDTMIVAIGAAADLPCHDRGVIDDYSHCLIVPALVDCSVSLARSPSVDPRVRAATAEAGPEAAAAMLARHGRYCHVHGVLGVADGDDPAGLVERFRRGMADEMVVIRTSGRLCRSLKDCEPGTAWGGDFYKIGYSPDIEEWEPAGPQLHRDELERILRRQRGTRKAVVVANGERQVAEALAAGCDAIEQGYAMGEANLRTMAQEGVLWIPAVLRARNALDGAGGGGEVACRFSQRYVAPGKPVPGAEAFWKKTLADQLAQLRLARELGVATAVGTGAGSAGILHGEAMVEEMKLFVKAGYSLAETIRCASAVGAEFFGMEKLGVLAAGRSATFLIARGTVQQLPRKLSYLESIFVNGAPSSAYRKNPAKH